MSRGKQTHGMQEVSCTTRIMEVFLETHSLIASGGDTASDNEEPTAASITVEDLVEPCLDHHHFSDVEQSFAQTVQFSKVRM